jgi:hypothetical protein
MYKQKRGRILNGQDINLHCLLSGYLGIRVFLAIVVGTLSVDR